MATALSLSLSLSRVCTHAYANYNVLLTLEEHSMTFKVYGSQWFARPAAILLNFASTTRTHTCRCTRIILCTPNTLYMYKYTATHSTDR